MISSYRSLWMLKVTVICVLLARLMSFMSNHACSKGFNVEVLCKVWISSRVLLLNSVKLNKTQSQRTLSELNIGQIFTIQEINIDLTVLVIIIICNKSAGATDELPILTKTPHVKIILCCINKNHTYFFPDLYVNSQSHWSQNLIFTFTTHMQIKKR